jgi:exodeoxyribonuclease-3
MARKTLKIATFNVNNVNKRLSVLLSWLRKTNPDIVCLQELKAAQHQFPDDALLKAGYSAVWIGEKTWNGVAILSKVGAPIVTRTRLPGDPKDNQARYLEAAIDGLLVVCVYAPNGNPKPGPKFQYKLEWMKRLNRHAHTLLKPGIPAVIAGDFNVVPEPIDIYPTKSWDKDALIQPESRRAFADLLKQGWIDAIRSKHPKQPNYTFWTYWRNRFENDHGLRLDHLLVSPELVDRFAKAGVDREVRAMKNASDHAPAWIVLRN